MFQNPLESDECDLSCSEITQKLRDWLDEDQDSHLDGTQTTLHDHGPPEVQEGKPGVYRASCYLGKLRTACANQSMFQQTYSDGL